MLAGQALLLLVPLGLAERRLPARRGLWAPILAASFLLANVFFGAILSIECAAFGDGAGSAWEWLGSATSRSIGCAIASTIVLLWIIWGVVFYRYARADDPEVLTKRATRWLCGAASWNCSWRCPAISSCATQRLLRADRDALGDCHRNFHHAVVVRTGRFLSLCRTLPTASPQTAQPAQPEPDGTNSSETMQGFKNRGEPTADPGIDRSSSLTPFSTSGTVQI